MEPDQKTSPFLKRNIAYYPSFANSEPDLYFPHRESLSPHRPSVRLPRSQKLPTPCRENPHGGPMYACFASSAEWPQSRITSSGLLGDPRPRADADQQFPVRKRKAIRSGNITFVFACIILQIKSHDSSTLFSEATARLQLYTWHD
jgi:hypothetical protein